MSREFFKGGPGRQHRRRALSANNLNRVLSEMVAGVRGDGKYVLADQGIDGQVRLRINEAAVRRLLGDQSQQGVLVRTVPVTPGTYNPIYAGEPLENFSVFNTPPTLGYSSDGYMQVKRMILKRYDTGVPGIGWIMAHPPLAGIALTDCVEGEVCRMLPISDIYGQDVRINLARAYVVGGGTPAEGDAIRAYYRLDHDPILSPGFPYAWRIGEYDEPDGYGMSGKSWAVINRVHTDGDGNAVEADAHFI